MNKLRAIAFSLYILITSTSYGQNPWQVQKVKDGITISNRHSDSSPFNDIRVELDVPGNIDQLSAILLDIKGYTSWAYATKESVLVKQMSAGNLIYYSEIEVPWPATNRYYFARFDLKKDPVTRTLKLLSTSIPDQHPPPKDLVRVPFSSGTWNVTTISPKAIHIDYILQLNPGGSLPGWMLNLFSSKGPMETFQNIKKKMTALNPS